MERARLQAEVTRSDFSAAPSVERLSWDDRVCANGLPGACSSLGPSWWQASSSQRDRKWLSEASVLFTLYLAEVRLRGHTGHTARARQSSRPLIRPRYFRHPIVGRKKSQVREFWVSQFWWNVFFSNFSIQIQLLTRRFSRILKEDALFVLLW